jgi:OHCU decarboxylase
MNPVLAAWNNADEVVAFNALIACCGSRRWAEAMVALRPFDGIADLSAAADRVWGPMEEDDWMEAFACHPRIGERGTTHAMTQSLKWSRQEQSSAAGATDRVLAELAECNRMYEQRFGFTYIVCATGKSSEEMLSILKRRIASERATELREAAEQQRQITQIRLGKWLIS